MNSNTKEQIKLGDKVRCKYSGFIGIAIARTEFINGCIQYCLVAEWDGTSPKINEMEIDEQSLEVIKPDEEKEDDSHIDFSGGGKMRVGRSMRGY